MKVKVRKKPVCKAERANGIRLRVHYNGIKIAGKCYSFGKVENLWKYVGSTVNVVKNKVFDSNGVFLGDINASNALFGRKVRCILALWAKSENKIPILFECKDKNATVFYGKSGNFYAYVTDNLHQNVVETAVSGTVWYVEV